MQRVKQGLAVVLASVWMLTPPAHAQDKEYSIKAAFIYNFTKFVNWPEPRAIPARSNIDICIFGDNSLSAARQVFEKASTPQLALSLVHEKNWQNAASHCHIVFIGHSETGRLGEALAALQGQPVLTVSDIDNFAERGGMIGFVLHENKIKLVINMKPAHEAGLKVNPQLLEVALKVIGR